MECFPENKCHFCQSIDTPHYEPNLQHLTEFLTYRCSHCQKSWHSDKPASWWFRTFSRLIAWLERF